MAPRMMMFVRLWHHYIGFLIAPSLLFFAFTGSLQLFSLHEAHGDYHPPALIEALGNVHKDQVFRTRPPRGAAPEHHHGVEDGDAPDASASANATTAPAHRHHHDDDDAGVPRAPANAIPPVADAASAPSNAAAPASNAAAVIRPASPEAAQPSAPPERAPKLGATLLKWWFLTVALGLVTSTCLGLWIGFNHVRRRWVALGLFALGAAVPIVLLLI